MRLRIAVLAASLLALGFTSQTSFGEDAVLAEIYGRGVHAFFSGDYEDAEATLSDAIAQGSKDPRAYYFRGLTKFALGRLDEANSDFALGAKEEVQDVALTALASRSLTRVQGGPRMLIEKARQTARKEHRAADVAREKVRYEQFKSDEKRVLRTVPAEEAVPAAPAKTEEAKPEEPKAEEAKPEEAPAAAKPEEPKAETPKPAEPAKPAADDPFGSDAPAAKPAAPAPATPPPAAPPAKDDPFGG